MLRLLLAQLIFWGYLLTGTAQTEVDSLPSNLQPKSDFMTELSHLMTDGKPKEVAEVYSNFAQLMGSGLFNEEERAMFFATAQYMRSKRLGATPHFKNYLGALTKLKQNAVLNGQLRAWHDVLDQMLQDEEHYTTNKAGAFLKFSNNFFTYNAVNYSPASVSWFTFGDDFSWEYTEQPILKVENATLTSIRSDDSLMITQTNFDYFPLEKKLHGNGGQTNWDRTSLGSTVKVELEKYVVETSRSIYDAPVAYLTFPRYFGAKTIKGSFSDKLVSDDSRTSYPRFESESNYLDVPNVGKGISLRGAFRLHGSTVFASGVKDRPAELLVLNERKQPRFHGEGNLVTIKEQGRIVGEDVKTIVYLGADSLYHPSANIRLNLSDLTLELSRGKKGTDRYPFYHSLHQMNIDADFIKANLNENELIIGRPTVSFVNKQDVTFESLHFFNVREYNRLQNIASANPLAIMKATAEREGNRFMSASMLANRINSRFTVENITPLLYDLVSKGFIEYDPNTGMVEMKEKTYHYVNAEAGNVDYDFLRLVSESDTVNATISLTNGYSLLNGVKKIDFSRKQKVAALPSGQQAYLRGNRNFDFDGRMYAGFGLFEGKDFHFKYEDFQVDLDSIRYFDLFVPTGNLDENQQPEALSIGSRIEHLSGVLLVDAPNNKSGQKDIFMFPSLQSKENSYVFYDRSDTKNGIYDRDSFYFELQPFSFDHLDVFGAQDLHFKGRLFSNGIFPDIEETLVLRDDDQSLGFSNESPEDGYPAYEGKGTYNGTVDLSNEGLNGQGQLKYLQATVDAEDFAFMPQTATASAESFDLIEDRVGEIPAPEVHGEQVNLEWRPYSDSLIVKSTEETPFELYRDDDHSLNGSLVLTPDGLRGAGDLNWSQATANSKIFSFGANSANADTMQIRIKALEVDDRLALETSNVNGLLDFDEDIGHFEANDESVITTLPYNQYITTMNEFDWDMKGSTITFEAEEGEPALFTSIHPDQDSLRFPGEKATYNLNTSLLQIIGVDRMVAADAYIYPDSQYVEIAPNANMAILENARIVADTSSEYHVINRATVTVKGGRLYEANGFYEYNVGPHEQEFELDDIIGKPVGKGSYSEKKVVTRANGKIEPSDTFFIDHKTQFRGVISLDAESESLRFNGFAKINAENLPNKYWFSVAFEGDKNDLVINYDIPKSYDSEPLFTGIFLSREFSRIYPRIMTPLLFRKDRQIFPVTKGVFRYLEDKDHFVFGDSSVVLANQLVGNKMDFNNKNGSVEAEGKFFLGQGLSYVKVDAAGRMKTNFPPPAPEEEPEKEDEGIMLADDPIDEAPDVAPPTEERAAIPVTAQWLMGIDMILPENLLKIVYNDFKSASFESRAIGYLSDIGFYQKAVREIFPESKERNDALDGLGLGFLDFPKKVNPYTFLFSNINMKWHQDYQSFVSTSKNNGLISINGEGLNKQVECYLEVKMPSAEDDDRLYIYLKSPSGLNYFFGFKQGIMSITSNNTVFMQQLEGMKEKDLIIKMDDGQTYEIQAVTQSSANLFLRRITAVQ